MQSNALLLRQNFIIRKKVGCYRTIPKPWQTYLDVNPLVHTLACWMMRIDDVVANNLDVHLQSFDLVIVFRNSMSDRDSKDQPFCSYAWTEVLWMSCGVWFQCSPSSWCSSDEIILKWSTALWNPHHLLTFAYDFASMLGDPIEQYWNIALCLSVLTSRLVGYHSGE
jgi:hypothetical protein